MERPREPQNPRPLQAGSQETGPAWTRKRILLPVLGGVGILGWSIGMGMGMASGSSAQESRESVIPMPTVTVRSTQILAAPNESLIGEDPSARRHREREKVRTVTATVTASSALSASPHRESGDDHDGDGDRHRTTLFYRDCDAVRAARAAPLYWWQAGYRRELDRDQDGAACD